VKKEHIMIEWLTDSCLMPTLGTCQGYKPLDLDCNINFNIPDF
jgi:hypothetical protein